MEYKRKIQHRIVMLTMLKEIQTIEYWEKERQSEKCL